MNKFSFLILAVIILSGIACCSPDRKSSQAADVETGFKYARLISMQDLDDNNTLVTIINPWDSTAILARYVLVEKGHHVTSELPTGTVTLHVPIDNAVVYSGIHTGLLNELGRLDAVSGVCDTSYISDRATMAAVRSGNIAYCGRNTSPLLEKMILLNPEAVVLSPYENSNESSRISSFGMKVVQAADYLETTPLGRAEWMRFFGRLFGVKDKADSLFKEVENSYLELKGKASKANKKPKVLFDRVYSGVWYVPTSGSVTGTLIEDAGGHNPFSNYNNHGSAGLTAEEVLSTAFDSDFWLIRYSEPEVTLKSLVSEKSLYQKFNAYQNGNVFVASTINSTLFDDGAFHPEKILRELIRILHSELDSSPLEYYKKAR